MFVVDEVVGTEWAWLVGRVVVGEVVVVEDVVALASSAAPMGILA